MLSQRDAVYNAVASVVGEPNGESVELTSEQRKKVQEIVLDGFKTGKIAFSEKETNQEKMSNPTLLRAYVSGLVNNWMRKDKRLNGGGSYSPKNPGMRAGGQDAQIRELRKLMSITEEEAHKTKIETAIRKRLTQLEQEKARAKVGEIDLSVLPKEIAALVK